MAESKSVWSPRKNGLSVSGLNLWLVDRTAFELQYLRRLEVVEPWNKNLGYGLLMQAGIEGFIKTGTVAGAYQLQNREFEKQIVQYSEIDEIAYWTRIAGHQLTTFIDYYSEDLKKYGVTKSELHHEAEVKLASGRTIKLHGYIDGEGDGIIMENKCRGEWDDQAIVDNIDLDLQFNTYCLLQRAATGELPQYVWYQHIRRPCGFGYKGPRKKAKESDDDYIKRLGEAINTDREYHFYRYLARPDKERFGRFCKECLFPILESFLDWYEYMTAADRAKLVNKYHWMQPYGLYDPFLKGTPERFREYRLTGTTRGLRPRR